MPETTIHPSGDKLQKALREFSELLLKHPAKSRSQLLQEVEIKFDLSPKECDFLNRNLEQE
jgi:hypothetical protein